MKIKNLILFILLSNVSFGQSYTISGTVQDSSSGEDIFGASIIVKELSNTGAKSNEYGFYSISLEAGSYTLMYRTMGYETIEKKIELNKDINLNISLSIEGKIKEFNEVKVTAVKDNNNITSSEMNVTKLTPKEIEAIPVLFGEKDIMKTLQLTPGVAGAGEGNAGFYVRGGSADQNLILLDEATVYNASHLLGFFSVFNSDAVKDVSLYKSGIPSRYGGRASSVMDVKLKEGNMKKFGASGGIGLISSRLSLEGPIVKNKGSFIISGRRTYIDIFTALSKKKAIKDFKLFFYDLNLKANYKISNKDRIFVSGYFGRDVLKMGKAMSIDWGNATGTIRYNRIFSKKLFSNTSFVYSNFNYKIAITEGTQGFGVNSSIQDWTLKEDFTLYANKNNTFKFGVSGIHHSFKPGALTGSEFSQLKLDSYTGVEYAAYVENDQHIGSLFSVKYGLRFSGFNRMGGKSYTFDDSGNQLTSTTHKKWGSVKNHFGLEPRLSMTYLLSEKNSIKLGYNRNYQYMHQLSNSTTSTPMDIWVPISNNVKPQIADQIALGYYHNIFKNKFKISTEVYYKHLQNQIDYRNGADLIFNNEIEGELVYGKGRTYGVEFQVKKTTGKLTGWVSYTLARSRRSFDAIDEGQEFSARQDRIHDLSVVLIYKMTNRLTLSSTFVFNTGNAVTFPVGKYEINGTTYPYYTERNGYRMPNYHRLDIGATWDFKERPNFEHSINISVYNAYARQNAYSVEFRKNQTTGKTEAVQTSLFRAIPSITYNFKFK